MLGQGGFGKVYLIYDKDTGRELAMKQVDIQAGNQQTNKVITIFTSFFVDICLWI